MAIIITRFIDFSFPLEAPKRFVIAAYGAGSAEYRFKRIFDLATVVDAFTASVTEDTSARVTGRVHFAKLHFDSFNPEQLRVCRFTIGPELSILFALYFRVDSISQGTRLFKRDYTDCITCLLIQKGRSDLSIIERLQCPLAQSHARYRAHGISHAAINFDPYYELLAIRFSRIVYTYCATSEHGHARSKQLARTHMAMQLFAFSQEFIK